MDPENPLVGMFQTITSSLAVRAAAQSAAAVQLEFYNTLVAEGMNEEQAMEMTLRSAEAVFVSASAIVDSLAENSESIGKAFAIIVDAVNE